MVAGTQSHLAQVLPSAGAPTASQYFSVTGKQVSGPFLNEFNRFGLQSIGWPISDQHQENGLTVQYFERVRMEYHPENAAPYDVLLSQLGTSYYKQRFGAGK